MFPGSDDLILHKEADTLATQEIPRNDALPARARLCRSIALTAATLSLGLARARADEGIQRITELGDREIVSQEKKKTAKPKGETYKAVETDDDYKTRPRFSKASRRSLATIFSRARHRLLRGFRRSGPLRGQGHRQRPDRRSSTTRSISKAGLGLTFYGSSD